MKLRMWSLNLISDDIFVIYLLLHHFRHFGSFTYEFSSFKFIVLFPCELSFFKSMIFNPYLQLHMNLRFEA